MNILIIGSEGFIGKNIVRYYLEKGYSVFGADVHEGATVKYGYSRISRLSPEFDQLLQAEHFDYCINAAGSGNVPYSLSHPVLDFEANCLDTIRILDGLRRFNSSCKYLHISSAAVYGNPKELPVKESGELSPISPYGWHKLISENLCAEYVGIFELQIAIARPFSVYGEGLKKQLFWDLFQKWKKAISKNEPVILWGTGLESRDFIYISDLVSSLDAIISRAEFNCGTYNIASGVESSIMEASSKFLHALGGHIEVQFNAAPRVGDPQNWSVDISKIKNLGFNPVISLDKGIEKLAKWLKNLE